MKKLFINLSMLAISVLFLPRASADEILPIPPVYQESPVWCWAAVSEMVLKYFDVPSINPVGDYQCGIAALVHPACHYNCGNCIVSAPNILYVNNVIRTYPQVANNVTGSFAGKITSIPTYKSLTRSEIKHEIDNERPIIVGISPSGFNFNNVSQHVALIVGYDDSTNFSVIVNDPYPYALSEFSGKPNPYLINGGEEIEDGQYKIRLSIFKTHLLWKESIYGIKCNGADCS